MQSSSVMFLSELNKNNASKPAERGCLVLFFLHWLQQPPTWCPHWSRSDLSPCEQPWGRPFPQSPTPNAMSEASAPDIVWSFLGWGVGGDTWNWTHYEWLSSRCQPLPPPPAQKRSTMPGACALKWQIVVIPQGWGWATRVRIITTTLWRMSWKQSHQQPSWPAHPRQQLPACPPFISAAAGDIHRAEDTEQAQHCLNRPPPQEVRFLSCYNTNGFIYLFWLTELKSNATHKCHTQQSAAHMLFASLHSGPSVELFTLSCSFPISFQSEHHVALCWVVECKMT